MAAIFVILFVILLIVVFFQVHIYMNYDKETGTVVFSIEWRYPWH